METPLMWTLCMAPSLSIFQWYVKEFLLCSSKPFYAEWLVLLVGMLSIVIAVPEKISKHLSFEEVEQSNVTDVSWRCENNSVGKRRQ